MKRSKREPGIMDGRVTISRFPVGTTLFLEMTRRKLVILARSVGRVKVRYLDDDSTDFCSPGTEVAAKVVAKKVKK